MLNYVTLCETDAYHSEQNMPILDVEIVASNTETNLPADLTQSLADDAARVFVTPQGSIWVKVRVIPSTHYAEDNEAPSGVYPVFPTVLKSRLPEGSALEDEIARILNCSEENVHIFYQPDGAGRVAFGEKLVK